MSEFNPAGDVDSAAIARFEGGPAEAVTLAERTRWQRFLAAIWPFTRKGGAWARYGGELGKAYVEAEVQLKQNEATRLAAEAAEIAARADVNRNESGVLFNQQVDNIFADDNLPEAVKVLKLAKLLETNPDLLAQLEKVREIMESLRLTRGTSVEISAALKLEVRNDPRRAATE
jgi:hypothetical protein